MNRKFKPKKYTCRYCGKIYKTFVDADLCFDLDMKMLTKEVKKKHNMPKSKKHNR